MQVPEYFRSAGSLEVSEHHLRLHAKGLRPDESLDLDLAVPLLDPASHVPAASKRLSAPDGNPPLVMKKSGLGLGGILPLPFGGATAGAPKSDRKPAGNQGGEGGGTFSLRCGPLSMSAQVCPNLALECHVPFEWRGLD